MIKRFRFRAVATLLSLSMICSVMTGCGDTTSQETSNSSEIVSSESSSTGADDDALAKAKAAEEEALKEKEAAQKAEEEAQKAVEEAKEAEEKAKSEEERLKAEQERLQAEEEAKRAEEERLKAEEEAKKAEEERLRAEAEQKKKEEEEAKKRAEEEKKLAEQMNSFSMMYYLAITAEDIYTSKNNRLKLDDIYTSLLNDINPGSVDDTTQKHLQSLRDVIKDFINVSYKRERLQFIYNQQKAEAIRSAVPNPLAVLSLTNALDWKKLAMNVVYTAVDSYTSYKNANESADTAFLMSGWDLDDEERAAVQKNRERAFDYMVDMVQEYGLDGRLTLNEKAIQKFTEICAIESVPEKIRRLTSEEETYSLLGNYWLELADCYFENSDYAKCLACVDKYQGLSTGIFRKDYNYAMILPKAIVAAQNQYSGDKYTKVISGYVTDLISNTEKSKEYWSTRYFAAQVYMDLYAKTNDKSYLKQAYEIAYDNVTLLLEDQRQLNSAYLNEVSEVSVPEPNYKFMTDTEKKAKKKQYEQEKKDAKAYNKALKEARKTELPSVYEPLALNCELLFGLAGKMELSSKEKTDIEAILQTSSNGIFLTKVVNDNYSFSRKGNKYSVTVSKDEIIIPANILTANATITMKISDGSGTTTISDCTIKKVERKGNNINDFSAYIFSDQYKKIKWSQDAKLTLTIKYDDVYNMEYVWNFRVSEYEKSFLKEKVVLKQE